MTDLMVFTRDLRTRDHPALSAGCDADTVVPVFVLDPAILMGPSSSANRTAVLLDSLADLRDRLRELGGDLFVRRGDWVEQIVALARQVDAERIHLSADVSATAARRVRALRDSLGDATSVHEHPGVTVLAPGTTRPTGGDVWKVFTPYHRSWQSAEWRPVLPAPDRLTVPDVLDPGEMPELSDLVDDAPSPRLAPGGETAALEALRAWVGADLADYESNHDDLAADATSRISAHLHLGCLSALEVATRLRGREGGAAFVRQLCWRDFYHQVLAAMPETSWSDLRDRGDLWNDDPESLDAWRQGRTGYPVVDAGMRQLLQEGFMHNRARMITASFLTKDLYVDWRHGAAHFMSLLVDGDVANNQLNWQWTAGTGTDSNPNRIFNPTVQSKRFDPDGLYIRRYVRELAHVPAPEIHEPEPATRERVGYPAPLVDHADAIAAYRATQEALRR